MWSVFNKKPRLNMEDRNTLPGWEKDIVERLAMGALEEQRRTRRWGIFFKFLLFTYLLLALLPLLLISMDDLQMDEEDSDGHTALIQLNGVIADNSDASADKIITALRRAFKDEDTKGIILRINSPGGSPVQSGYINDEMERLREEYPDIPLYAVITDICASGGYYIAVGAEKIYADKSSLVGSIGVLMSSFGFVDALDKLGVERRLMTAGEHKGFLDPFLPKDGYATEHLQTVLDQLHQQFIAEVKQGRGERLADNDKLFSGLIWSGEEAVKLGLIDGLATSSSIARNVFEAKHIVEFTVEEDYLERLSKSLGVSFSLGIKETVQKIW